MTKRERDGSNHETDSTPTGETLLGSGYGAGDKEVIHLVPPPDDLGVGVTPVASGGDSSNPPPSDPPTRDGQGDEDGGIPIHHLLILAFALLAVLSLGSSRSNVFVVGALIGAGALLFRYVEAKP